MGRNTKQKCIILDALRALDHPSATEVYAYVREIDPTISRSTVFRILSNNAEEGKILRLHIEGTDDRFDHTLKKHCHIKCTRCGRVEDVDCDAETYACENARKICDYDIRGCEITFYGLCPECRKFPQGEEK